MGRAAKRVSCRQAVFSGQRYLVKIPVKNTLLRALRVLGCDTNHWALRIGDKHYHLTTNGTRSKFIFTQKPIPREEVVEEMKVGITRMSDEDVVHEGVPILRILKTTLTLLQPIFC